MMVIKVEIHKMLVRIANTEDMEDPDQTASSETTMPKALIFGM